jgi:hypothetical protein
MIDLKIKGSNCDDELGFNLWPDFCPQQWHDSESEQHA